MRTLPELLPVDQLALSTIVELVNEFGDEPRRAAGESAHRYPDLVLPATVGGTTDDLVRLANRLHPVFSDPSRAPAILNRLVEDARLVHRLDDQSRLVWTRPATGDALVAAAVAAMVDFVDTHGPSRLGTCAADACVDVYTDQSQATNRRYCSPQCHNRARVARWRDRQTKQGPSQ